MFPQIYKQKLSNRQNNSTGFQDPTDEFTGNNMDLNELLIRNPAASFFFRAKSDEFKCRGISKGDLLLVDRSIRAKIGQLVVVTAETQKLTLIEIASSHINMQQHSVWGVVTTCIKTLDKQ